MRSSIFILNEIRSTVFWKNVERIVTCQLQILKQNGFFSKGDHSNKVFAFFVKGFKYQGSELFSARVVSSEQGDIAGDILKYFFYFS